MNLNKILALTLMALLTACASTQEKLSKAVPDASSAQRAEAAKEEERRKAVETNISKTPDWFLQNDNNPDAIYVTATEGAVDMQLSIDMAMLSAIRRGVSNAVAVSKTTPAANFDKLDISALLQGFNAQTPSNLSDWITGITVAKLSAYDTSNTTTFTIAVNGPDQDPDDDPDKYVWIKQEIMLEQVDVFSGLGLAADATLSAQLAALKTAGILIA